MGDQIYKLIRDWTNIFNILKSSDGNNFLTLLIAGSRRGRDRMVVPMNGIKTLSRLVMIIHSRHRNIHLYDQCSSQQLIVCLMVLNATFNNISVISWRSVLLVEETRVPRWNHRTAASYWQTLSHYVVSSTPRHERDSKSQLHSSHKSNYHTITTTTTLSLDNKRPRHMHTGIYETWLGCVCLCFSFCDCMRSF
jgi:hypothetical protein